MIEETLKDIPREKYILDILSKYCVKDSFVNLQKRLDYLNELLSKRFLLEEIYMFKHDYKSQNILYIDINKKIVRTNNYANIPFEIFDEFILEFCKVQPMIFLTDINLKDEDKIIRLRCSFDEKLQLPMFCYDTINKHFKVNNIRNMTPLINIYSE